MKRYLSVFLIFAILIGILPAQAVNISLEEMTAKHKTGLTPSQMVTQEEQVGEDHLTDASKAPVIVDDPPTFIFDDSALEEYVYVPKAERETTVSPPAQSGDTISQSDDIPSIKFLESTPSMTPEEAALWSRYTALLGANEYYSTLSKVDGQFLCEYAKVNSSDLEKLQAIGLLLSESLWYAQLASEYSFSIEELYKACATEEDLMKLSMEMKLYTSYLADHLVGGDLDKELRAFLLGGVSFEQIKTAYGISETLGIDMSSLLDKDGVALKSDKLTAVDQTNYELYAADLGVNVNALVQYAQDNNLSFRQLEKIINDGCYYESQLGDDLVSPESMMSAAAAGEGETEYPDKNLGAPYSYDYNKSESVNINTGSLIHETVGYTLPGVNGLDLVIGHRYSSDSSSIYDPVGAWSSSPIYQYYVEYGALAYYERPGIPRGRWSYYDEGPYYTDLMSKSNAQSIYNSLPTGSERYENFDSDGTDLILVYYKSMYQQLVGYSYSSYSSTQDSTYLNNLYGLGQGWSFMFSSIENVGNEKYLHLSDGRAFEITITSAAGDSNLKDYTLTDLRLERESNLYSNGSTSSYYTLYYKDGKREFFSSDGKLIGIKDRFDNTIKFVNDTYNGYPRITITDTLNRVTVISGQNVTGGHVMTVALPGSVTLKYTVANLTSPVSSTNLAKYQDPMNIATNYSYTVSSGGFNVYSKNTSGATNYFMNLTTITHPTGAQTIFDYESIDKNLGPNGLQRCFRLKSRVDKIGQTSYNEKTYTYSSNNNSGWPAQSDPTNLPADFTYSTTIKTALTGLEETYTFNNKHLTTSIKSNVGTKKIQDKLFDEYNSDKLPVKVTTKTYDDTNNNTFVQAIELAEYDAKGNVTASWTPLANGSKSNTEYKTTYIYDLTYSQLKSVSYKQNPITTIQKTYTLDSGNRHPLTEIVTVDGVQKSKTEWGYDSFGNVTSKKCYKDGLAAYYLTEYTYQNNAYLSSIKTNGVFTADGASVAASPGYSSGVIATKYKYDTLGRLEEMTDPRGYKTSYLYNAKNDLTQVTNPDGSIHRYDRSYTGDMTQSIKYISDMAWTRETNSNRKQEPVKRDLSMAGGPLSLQGQSSSIYTKGIGTAGSSEIVIPLDGSYEHFICDIGIDNSCSEPYTLVAFSVYADNALIYESGLFAYQDGQISHLDLNINGARELKLKTVATPIDSNWEDYYLYDAHLFYVDWADAKLTKQTVVPGGSTILFTNEKGSPLKTTYTPLGLEYETIDVLTNTVLSRKTYDALSRLATDTDLVNNNVTTYAYDYLSRMTSRTVKQGSATLAQETYKYAVTSDGLLKTTKTQVGDSYAPSIITTSYVNNIGFEVKTGKFLNSTEYFDTAAYDYTGNKTQSLTALDASKGRSFTAKWEYDHMGQVTKETNTLNQSMTRTYDALGRNVIATDYTGSITSFTYDALGRLIKQETPFEKVGSTVYTTVKKYDYDQSGNITCEQTQNNASGAAASWSKTEYVYDSRGFLKTVSGYDGSTVAHKTQYTYDAVGNILTQQVGTGTGDAALTTYTYDRFGNPLTMTDSLEQTESCTYDLAGHVLTKTDRNGAITTYTYDGLGRPLTTSVMKDGVNTGETMISYTFTGQIKTMSNDRFTVTNTYDALGRLKKGTETGNVVKDYTYDIGGNRDSFTLTSGGVSALNTTYEYDELGRLKKVKEDNVEQAAYTYDTNGNRATLTAANGVTASYAYNLANMVTSLQNKKGTEVQSSFTYTYYLDGNQESKSDNMGRVTNYTYDGLGRLTQEAESGAADAKTYAYTYDTRSNRQMLTVSGAEMYTVAYSYDLNNRLLKTTKTVGASVETTAYRYDSNGNTLSSLVETLEPAAGGMGVLSFGGNGYELNSYNGLNQLVSTVKDGVETTYDYKPDGLRWSKTVSGIRAIHIWDGQNIVAELKDNSITAKYLRGVNLIWAQDSDGKTYYSYNAHGDVVQLTDETGAVTKEYHYDAFGVESSPTLDDGNPFRYCGEYLDSETDTYYIRARNYDPIIGRFTQEDTHWNPSNMIYGDNPVKWNERKADEKDPLGLNTYTYKSDITAIMQSGNLYVYCMNNPLMYVDQNGESIILACILIGVAAGAIMGGFTAAQISKSKLGYVDGKWVLGGAITGGLIGGLAGWGVGAAATAIGVKLAAGSGGVLGATLLNSWQQAEQYVRSTYNAVKHTFDIPGMASRMVDGFNQAKGIIYEVKYGYASLSQFIQTEITRDVWLMHNNPAVKAVEWHFYQSVSTGKGGPSGPLLEALAKAGIKVIFH